MKKFLKIFITLLVVVALVFGIRFLVNRGKGNDYLYVQLNNRQQNNNVKKDACEENFDELITFVQDSSNQSKIDDTVKTIMAENGEFDLLKKIYANCDTNYDYFSNLLALSQTSNSKAQSKILSCYDSLVKQIEKHQKSLSTVIRLTQNSAVLNKVDFKASFNKFFNDYSKSVELYGDLVEQMSRYVLENAYNGLNTNYTFVINTICAKMDKFASANHNLLTQANTLLLTRDELLSAPNYEFVNDYLAVSDIDDFLKCEDKATFISNKSEKDRGSYQGLNNLFRGDE